jgi:hypothetical protein
VTLHQEAALTPFSRFFSQAQILADTWSTLTSRGRSREAKRIVQEFRLGATREEVSLVRLVLHELDAQLTRAIDEAPRRKTTAKGIKSSKFRR